MIKTIGNFIISKIEDCEDTISVVFYVAIFFGFLALYFYVQSYIIMLIWNNVIITIFDFATITVSKAFWLNIICCTLFKSNIKITKE